MKCACRLPISVAAEFYEATLGLRVWKGGSEGAVAEGQRALVSSNAEERARRPSWRRLVPLPSCFRIEPYGAIPAAFGRIGAAPARGPPGELRHLQDPDNLGIEVYADRPRIAWHRVGSELMMATDPLDVEGLMRAAGGIPWTGMPPGTKMGHVHLHVRDLRASAEFYSEALGFDRTVWGYPGALFMSAGGYHHHLGTNTWAGQTAMAPAEEDARLLEGTIELPDVSDLDLVEASVRQGGYAVDRESRGRALVTRDPWGTQVRLRAGAG